MSGQYPPPNPTHPYSRPQHHQRAPPTMPPWGRTPQSTGLVGSSLNFYGSPHMGLPNRGAQPWVPPQTHPKPLDTRPGNTNPLFGLHMLMSPEANQRIPSEYQQEETMDLSSHSSTLTTVQEVPKIVNVRSENTDVLRNGTIVSPEVNGDLERTTVTETETKDSIVTSVIATNPLREPTSDALNCSRVPLSENSVVKRVETSTSSVPESIPKDNESFKNPRLTESVKSDSVVVDINTSEHITGCVSSVLKTTVSSIKPVVRTESVDCKTLGDSSVVDLVENNDDEISKPDEPLDSSKSTESSENNTQSTDSTTVNESQLSILENSSLSVDTDDSKLVVADASAEDIFGISPVDNPVVSSQETTDKSGESSETPTTVVETLPEILEKNTEAVVVSSVLNDQIQCSTKSTPAAVSSAKDSEPHPSVENVEILLENMFNSQEETSCSSQNSNSGVPQSVIVSNGSRLLGEVNRPSADVITPMKEEELAKTLAEDTPIDAEVEEEKKEEKITDDVMDEIEKKLEMLTESSSTEVPKDESQSNIETPVLKLLKEEPDIVDDKNQIDLLSKEIEPVKKVEEPVVISTQPECPEVKPENSSASNPFIEVETQLEKMFAGIVEPVDETCSDNPSQPSVSEPKRPVVTKKSIVKRKKANSRRPSDNSVFGGSSGDSAPLKKKGRKRVNDSGSERGSKKMKIDNVDSFRKGRTPKDVTSDNLSKLKGPFVHIEGSKESPASVVVVNSGARADDDDGIDKANARRKHSKLHRSEGVVRRAGPAYSSSTLSIRYNSDTADLSWVCIFCKKGPHCMGGLGGEPAGDLFGPYRIPSLPPGDDSMPPGTPSDKDVVEEQKKRGGKHPKSLRASGAAEHFIQKMAKKNKRSLSSDSWEPQSGLLAVDGGYEVWLHGPCAEWAPGLCIIGTQLVGLEDAVWTALRTRCSQCGEHGAAIGCVMRSCASRMHYHCATLCGWLLDTDTFIARCHVHRTRLRPA